MGVVSNVCTDTGSRFGSLLWVVYSYQFANAQTFQIGPKKMPTFAEAEIDCDALIPSVEVSMLDGARRQAARLLADPIPGQIAQDVIPDFPEELPLSDADVAVDTRQRDFHRWLIRWVWPRDLLTVELYLGDLWLWLEQMNSPTQQTYLAIDSATVTEISQRMGNAVTVGGLVDADVPGEIA